MQQLFPTFAENERARTCFGNFLNFLGGIFFFWSLGFVPAFFPAHMPTQKNIFSSHLQVILRVSSSQAATRSDRVAVSIFSVFPCVSVCECLYGLYSVFWCVVVCCVVLCCLVLGWVVLYCVGAVGVWCVVVVRCYCDGVVFLWWCFCGGVVVFLWCSLWWCFCGGVLVAVW